MIKFFDENFWVAISFIFFIYLIYKPARTAILKALDNKISTIQEEVLKAERLKKDAELLFKKTTERVEQLKLLRAQMLEESKKNLDSTIEAKRLEMVKFLEHKKIETIKLIEEKQVESNKNLERDYCNKVINLTLEYFQASKNNLSVIDIVKNLAPK